MFLIFSDRVFLIFFDINWTKKWLYEPKTLAEKRKKKSAAAFRKLPMFHQRHKCLPVYIFSIKKNVVEAEKILNFFSFLLFLVSVY
jgi:hypothetical protein